MVAPYTLILTPNRSKKAWPPRKTPVPEFIDPVLGMKTLVFAKTCPKRSFSIQSVPRDAGFSLFWMRLDLG
jgi:hypothetical protein